MNETIDTLKPWTVRGMPARVSEAIATEAHLGKISTARLVEMMYLHWTQGSSSEQRALQPPPAAPPARDHDLIALLHAAAALAAHTKIPREVRARINRLARAPKPGSSTALGIGHDAAT